MKRYQRQTMLVAAIAFALADLTNNTFTPMIELPVGAVVDSAWTDIEVAFNDTGTEVLDIGTSSSANAYHNDLNLKAKAKTAFTTLPGGDHAGSKLAAKTTVGITRVAQNNDGTAGEGLLVIQYFVVGRGGENFGTLDGGPVTS